MEKYLNLNDVKYVMRFVTILLLFMIISSMSVYSQGFEIKEVTNDLGDKFRMRVIVNGIYDINDINDVKIYVKGYEKVPWIQISVLDYGPFGSGSTVFFVPRTSTEEVKVLLESTGESDFFEVSNVDWPEGWPKPNYVCESKSDCPDKHLCTFERCIFQYGAFQCEEFDGGINKEVFSVCNDGVTGEKYEDYCGSTKLGNADLIEYYCDVNGNCPFKELKCEEEEICIKGACVKVKDACPENCKCSDDGDVHCVLPDRDDDVCPKGCKCEGDKIDCESNEVSITEKCILGCEYNNRCILQGTRLVEDNDVKYCGIDGNLKSQKIEDDNCQNNYECSTNLCINNQCVSPGLWQKFLDFFRTFFG